jgi:hypothetical protein
MTETAMSEPYMNPDMIHKALRDNMLLPEGESATFRVCMKDGHLSLIIVDETEEEFDRWLKRCEVMRFVGDPKPLIHFYSNKCGIL